MGVMSGTLTVRVRGLGVDADGVCSGGYGYADGLVRGLGVDADCHAELEAELSRS